jgi:hypothetical protein
LPSQGRLEKLPQYGGVSLGPGQSVQVERFIRAAADSPVAPAPLKLTVISYGETCPPGGEPRPECEDDYNTDVLINSFVNLDFEGVADEKEGNPGGLVALNDDDDNDNGVPDLNDPGSDPDTKMLTLALDDPPAGTMVKLREKLHGGGRVQLYLNGDRTDAITLPATWSAEAMPATLHAEGRAVSSSQRDIELSLKSESPGGRCEDIVRLTVVQTDLDVDSNNQDGIDPDNSPDGTDDPIEAAEYLLGLKVTLNSNRDERNVDANGDPLPDWADDDLLREDPGHEDEIVLDDLEEMARALLPSADLPQGAYEVKLSASEPNAVCVWAVNPGQTDADQVPFGTDLLPVYFAPGAPRAGWKWYIEWKGTDGDKVKLTLAVHENPGGSVFSRDELYVTGIGARLLWVAFGDSHEVTQDSGAPYTLPIQWWDKDDDMQANDVGESRHPVAYTRNTLGEVSEVRFKMLPFTFGASAPTNVRGTDVFGNQYVASGSQITSYSGTEIVVASDMLASGRFPDTVRYLGQDFSHPYTIVWEMSGDGGLTWYPVGESDNRLFLLLANPDGPYSTPLYETVGWLSCRAADGLSDENDVFAAIWSEFTDLDVRRKPKDGENSTDGVQMGYWLTDTPNQTLGGMLADNIDPKGDGSCRAWARFLIACGNAHGIGSNMVKVKPDMAVNPRADYLLVKHWVFGSPSSSPPDPLYPYEVQLNLATPKDVNSDHDAGISAQHVQYPLPRAKNFGLHYVVKYGSEFYDPSYGTGPFASEQAHEAAAADGICTDGGRWARQKAGPDELDYYVFP